MNRLATLARLLPRLVLRYLPWLAGQLLLSTARLTRDVATPGSTQRPRIVRLDMTGLSELEVALLTSSITITPGTLVLAVATADADHGRAAYVHGLFGDDERELVEGLEQMRERVCSTVRGARPRGKDRTA